MNPCGFMSEAATRARAAAVVRRQEKGQSGEQPTAHLARPTTIYVFRCDESGLYAFTADPEGHSLPWRLYPRICWRLQRCIMLQQNGRASDAATVGMALDALAEHGFHLAHAAVDAELLAVMGQCGPDFQVI
jgi:hypothetical protein